MKNVGRHAQGVGRRPRILRAAAGCWLFAAAVLGQVAQPSPGDPEARLWSEISTLAADSPAGQTYPERLATGPARSAALVEKTRAYLLLYPGGPHRDDAIRLELSALFEQASLRGGDFAGLEARLRQYQDVPPSAVAREEAAYWQIFCDRARRSAATTQPSSAPVLAPDAALLEAYRRYLDAFPGSRHAPRMATVLFDDALSRGALPEMERIVAQRTAVSAGERTTAALAAALRREQAVGRIFWLTGETPTGEPLDTRSFAGRPVVIVVWASFDPAAVNLAAEVERERSANPEIAVVGVNIDEQAEALASAAEALGIDWPQVADGLGWAGEFVTSWGVRQVPTVFVIDRDGRLAGAATDARWRRLLATVARAK